LPAKSTCKLPEKMSAASQEPLFQVYIFHHRPYNLLVDNRLPKNIPHCHDRVGKEEGEKQQSERTKNKRVSLARTIEANPDNTYLRSNDASQAIQTSKCLSSIMTACSYPQHSTMHTMIFTYIKQKLGVRYTCCTF